MTDKILVDTTLWVDYLRGSNDAVRKRLSALVTADKVMTADIIVLEILRGAKSDREYEMLHRDFSALPRLGMTAAVWERAWNLGYTLRRKGIQVPLTDTIIAALALEYACALLHADRHFDLIAEQTDLKVLRADDG